MAPLIVEQLGPHRAYYGICCGSLAVEMAKEPSSQETVCDLHGDLVNLARVLRDEATAADLYARLSRTLASEQLFEESKVFCASEPPNGPDVERAYHYFFSSWLGRNGVAGTKRSNLQIATRWTNNGGSPTIRLRSAIDSIPDWHVRLCNILILRRDCFKVLESVEDEDGTAIYADPPYLTSTRTGKDAASRYLHEFASADHERLAAGLCRFRKARVVVSYYHDERLSQLYPGWVQLDCTRAKNLSVQGRRGAEKQEAPEVLLINGPSLGGQDAGGLFQ
jgi:DNA adenine methylase